MKRLVLLLAIGAVFSSCSSLPQVRPAGEFVSEHIHQTCRGHFPTGKWQFVHSIEAVMPGGKRVFVIGAAVISSMDRSFRCVIMTIEGLVVFDAEYRGRLTVKRAIPPFDSQAFAEGLAKDIRLIFLHPPGPPVESGFLKSGASICRHRSRDGGFVDVVCHGEGNWEIRQYAQDFRLLRTVKITSGKNTGPDGTGIPKRIQLTAHGSQGYKLIMKLIEAVPIKE